MTITPGERNGVKGNYLDALFCPVFFPDTPEGNAALDRWIDSDLRWCRNTLIAFAVTVLSGLLFFTWMACA